MPRVAFTIGVQSKAAPYVQALNHVGLDVEVLVWSGETQSLEGFDGLVLGGGRDVDPALYGEQRLMETQEPDSPRDAFERRLINQALATDLPVFAICRGLQILNVHLGGTLHQHIGESHHDTVHAVSISPDCLLARSAGTPAYKVRSRHHQAVRRPAPGARVAAVAEDSTIEALEFDGARFLLAVQWHPEDQFLESPYDRRLFESFARAVS